MEWKHSIYGELFDSLRLVHMLLRDQTIWKSYRVEQTFLADTIIKKRGERRGENEITGKGAWIGALLLSFFCI